MSQKTAVAILGASGYTGAELIRMLVNHPFVEIAALTADRRAGQSLGAVFPHLDGLGLPDLVAMDEVDYADIGAVFCALPHGTTQEVVAALPEHVRVIDLSADFRLYDLAAYETWYGHPHQAPHLQAGAVYGLTEINRDAVRAARLIANPGCYPTCSLLALAPLLARGLILTEDIVIDAKSGVSGAGRAAKEATLYCEVNDGLHAYGVASHRHVPEIEQELSTAAGAPITVSFTPHLVPMNRGMLATIYAKLAPGQTADGLRTALREAYDDEPFVRVLEKGLIPQTRHVRGANDCLISVSEDRAPGRVILCSVIDNLVKGASGQAIQNFNVMFGHPETTALEQKPMFP